MRLTERKLRRIIREEINSLTERYDTDTPEGLVDLLTKELGRQFTITWEWEDYRAKLAEITIEGPTEIPERRIVSFTRKDPFRYSSYPPDRYSDWATTKVSFHV